MNNADPQRTARAPLRVAIAGAAHPHVRYVLDELSPDRNPDLALVAVADPAHAVAAEVAAPFAAARYTDHRRMLAEIVPDLVVVAGVYGDRGAVIIDALHAGAHVIADKPMCTTVPELDAIERAVRETGRFVTLLLEKRGYPVTIAALELVRSGALGAIVGITSSGPHKLLRPTRPAWFFDHAAYGGILNDLAVHDIDAALLFSGARAGVVTGAVRAPLAGAPSFATYGQATMQLGETLVASEVSWLTPAASSLHGDYRMRITGTTGTAELFWARNRLVVTTDTAPTHEVPLPPGLRPAEQAVRALAAGDEPATTTRDGLLATRVALLAQESASLGSVPLSWP